MTLPPMRPSRTRPDDPLDRDPPRDVALAAALGETLPSEPDMHASAARSRRARAPHPPRGRRTAISGGTDRPRWSRAAIPTPAPPGWLVPRSRRCSRCRLWRSNRRCVRRCLCRFAAFSGGETPSAAHRLTGRPRDALTALMARSWALAAALTLRSFWRCASPSGQSLVWCSTACSSSQTTSAAAPRRRAARAHSGRRARRRRAIVWRPSSRSRTHSA